MHYERAIAIAARLRTRVQQPGRGAARERPDSMRPSPATRRAHRGHGRLSRRALQPGQRPARAGEVRGGGGTLPRSRCAPFRAGRRAQQPRASRSPPKASWTKPSRSSELAVTRDPESARAHGTWAARWLDAAASTKACAIFSAPSSLAPKDPAMHYDLGVVLLEGTQFRRRRGRVPADARARSYPRRRTQQPRHRARLAGRVSHEAIDHFQQALNLDPVIRGSHRTAQHRKLAEARRVRVELRDCRIVGLQDGLRDWRTA